MTIRAAVLPTPLSSLSGRVVFHTDITVGKSGTEIRNANWQDSLHRYNAATGIKTKTDIDTLRAWFYSMQGREIGFLLQDLDDYKIPTQQQITSLTSTTYQIEKWYADSLSNYHKRKITRPSATASDLAVYANGVLQTGGGVNYSYSSTTGVITFTGTPATPVTITLAKFYVPVRFDTDELDFELLMANSDGTYSLGQCDIPLVEIRE